MHRQRTSLLDRMLPSLHRLVLGVLLLLMGSSDSFLVSQHRTLAVVTPRSRETPRIYNKVPSSSYPEYLVEENLDKDNDDGNDNENDEDHNSKHDMDAVETKQKPATIEKAFPDSNTETLTQKKRYNNNNNESPSEQPPMLQFAAMEPGTVVQIQVGDVSLARKAWKKRRRSGSPLLIPCSVLNVDRQSNTRWNLIYLLEKFGTSYAGGGGGIRISLAELVRRYRSHLQSSLTHQAHLLGYETPYDLVQALFQKQVQDSYGVQLVVMGNDTSSSSNNNNDNDDDDDDSNNYDLWLRAPLSRLRAQKRANKAVVLQFQDDPNNQEDDTLLRHTGLVRCRRTDSEMSSSSSSSSSSSYSKNTDNRYNLQPLSAALRVKQEDVDSGTIQNGSFHAALIYDFDPAGDAGNPLLILTLNPATNQIRDRLKIVPDYKHEPISNPLYMLKDLAVGDGPIVGKVARIVKGGALVDCNVGRESKTRDFAENIKVYGMLRFQDAVTANDDDNDDSKQVFSAKKWSGQDKSPKDEEEENWDEIVTIEDLDKLNDEGENVEDITHLFEMNQDGSLTYRDPESGETTVISTDDEDEDEDDEKVETKLKAGDAQEYTQMTVDRPKRLKLDLASKGRPQWLHVGDYVDVYVKAVSKQSGQFQLTMDCSIQGRKAKEIKKEGEVNKKLARLAKQLGGLHRIDELRGQECDGVIKATSNAGDWLYIQPIGIDNLPVGVATVPDELLSDMATGDSVRIQIQGVDENRGQLAMRVLSKQ